MSVKGEKYASKSAMMKHEKTEPASVRKKEYGSETGGLFGTKKKAVAKKAGMHTMDGKMMKNSAMKKAAPKKMGKKK